MKRLDINSDTLFSEYTKKPAMVETPTGKYVTFEELIALLDVISNSDADLSPRAAVIDAVFDAFGDTK